MYKFSIGEIIHHKRYDYRGVIVAADPKCLASESWYKGNRTQPDRDKPWYHVLVHNGANTYVAEENLEPDPSGGDVSHPDLELFFAMRINGKYQRFCPN